MCPAQWVALFLCGSLLFLLKVNNFNLYFVLDCLFSGQGLSLCTLLKKGKKAPDNYFCCDFILLMLGVARSHSQWCACSKGINPVWATRVLLENCSSKIGCAFFCPTPALWGFFPMPLGWQKFIFEFGETEASVKDVLRYDIPSLPFWRLSIEAGQSKDGEGRKMIFIFMLFLMDLGWIEDFFSLFSIPFIVL